MQFLGPKDDFPPVEMADESGLLAFGGDLTPERLILAYKSGIFPWYDHTQPVLWWSPDPRMVLFPKELKISKSMKQLLRRNTFEVTHNQEFQRVVEHCATIDRAGEQGTWITREMQQAYLRLFELGYAQSVEVWKAGELVGGLYGIYLKDKGVFCGESMFAKRSNASKFGFIKLVQKMAKEGVRIIDCQVYTDHLASLGARTISRKDFLEYLK